MKFFWKVFFQTISVVAVAFSIGSYILISSVFHAALNRETELAFDENLMVRFSLETAFANVPTRYDDLQDDTIYQIAQRIVGESQSQFIRISSGTLTPIYAARGVSLDNAILNQVKETAISYQIAHADGKYFVQTAGQIMAGNKVLYLETFRDITPVFQEKEHHFATYKKLAAAMLAAVAVVILLLSVWLTRPIRALSGAARAISQGDFKQRVEKADDDEIGSLTKDFNFMADALEEKIFKLEEAARQREDFVASFAHELKTPLTSIIGYADMLRSYQLDAENQLYAANYIFSEGRRLETLALKLMDIIILKRRDLNKKEISTVCLFKDIADAFALILPQKNIELKINHDEAIVTADEDLIKILFINLIDNAQKATADGGVIEFSGTKTAEGYIFTVRDFGVGITQEELSKITEAFYMVDKSRARTQNSYGLGLSLCAEIADLHNARLEFESELGQGTVVRLRLENGGAK